MRLLAQATLSLLLSANELLPDTFDTDLKQWDIETAIINADESSFEVRSRNIRSLELGFMLEKCDLSNALIHQCLRIYEVCGKQVEQLSEQLFVYSRARTLENEEDKNLGRSSTNWNGGPSDTKLHNKLKKMLEFVDDDTKLQAIESNVTVMGVGRSGTPQEVNIQNPEARCSVIRLRKWRNRCEQCVEQVSKRK